jgi:hypothetical protein
MSKYKVGDIIKTVKESDIRFVIIEVLDEDYKVEYLDKYAGDIRYFSIESVDNINIVELDLVEMRKRKLGKLNSI